MSNCGFAGALPREEPSEGLLMPENLVSPRLALAGLKLSSDEDEEKAMVI